MAPHKALLVPKNVTPKLFSHPGCQYVVYSWWHLEVKAGADCAIVRSPGRHPSHPKAKAPHKHPPALHTNARKHAPALHVSSQWAPPVEERIGGPTAHHCRRSQSDLGERESTSPSCRRLQPFASGHI
ncbi:hypothetical protein L596_008751 [Steinernema carpocapsae]|uniref:Uncharacterized protein n=1 Tax=Steinernema carpocapsae TaxID=34508 RepID=A0A4V6A6I1_STECR|nr:hypothetical protein L596_008751 [Steinernema carpocapsae]